MDSELSERRREIDQKVSRLRELMKELKVRGLLLSTYPNFCWITAGGENAIVITTEKSLVHILVTQSGRYCLAPVNEFDRIRDEELPDELGFEFVKMSWNEDDISEVARKIAGRGLIGTDTPEFGCRYVVPIPQEIAKLRFTLTTFEVRRAKELSKEATETLERYCLEELKPGKSELEVAGDLWSVFCRTNIMPVVMLVASDDRVMRYRHPTPTPKRIERYVMIIVCARRRGLITALTRSVYFGRIPKELKDRYEKTCHVLAKFILNTRAGRKVSHVFKRGISEYRNQGYPKEWCLHHQGGLIGYLPREYIATSDTGYTIEKDQMFAWNPTIQGTKAEETSLVTGDGPEILTFGETNWPTFEAEVLEGKLKVHDILNK